VGGSGSVANASIIELSGADVRTHFDSAISALEETLKFLEAEAGVIPECLPSETGILPIAYVAKHRPRVLLDQTDKDRLLRWFWAATFLQRYGRGGTNTRVVQDSTDLYNWVIGTEAEPSWITSFWSAFQPAALLEAQPTNEVLLRGILALQNLSGAIDWSTGDEIRTRGRQPRAGAAKPTSILEQHHVYPSENELPGTGGRLTDEPQSDLIPADTDMIVNRVLLLESTNQSLHATPPSSLAERGIELGAVATHLIDPETLTSWDEFVRDRIKKIEASVEAQLPKPVAAVPS
jgi:hypothetical protein